ASATGVSVNKPTADVSAYTSATGVSANKPAAGVRAYASADFIGASTHTHAAQFSCPSRCSNPQSLVRTRVQTPGH
ncbi:MAG: hypothetical protein K0U66_01270, partial [Gammaproteobacteria bacterium]|nr:hypothetical protein [Gammaproteobacteria bacterium]